jgi:hypothetical protein
MKTLGLLATIAIALPLGGCIERDHCDSQGWCDDNNPSRVCFYDSDCGKDYLCQGGTCVARLPVPPPRGSGGTSGNVGGAGGRQIDAGVDSRDGGQGGAVIPDGGVPGTGGRPASDGGAGSGAGGSRPVDGGAGGAAGAAGQPGTGGATPGCDAGAGCHPHPCESAGDCGTGQVCTGGFCTTPTTSGGQCVFNADCGAGKTCINGTCHANCAVDTDCPAQGRDRCVGGICQPNTGSSPQCRASADCVGIHVTVDDCVNAVCRTPCLSDTECCVGSSGSICQMGYCVTAHEVAPQCRITSDCGAGTMCIDAACE